VTDGRVAFVVAWGSSEVTGAWTVVSGLVLNFVAIRARHRSHA
jgi:hypothetical protein